MKAGLVEGNIEDRISFLGEAAGAMEDKTSRLFRKSTGKFLNGLFKVLELEETRYIL